MGKNEDHLQRTEIRAILDELERKGLIEKNGKYRRARSGELRPVYVATQKGKAVADERLREAHGGWSRSSMAQAYIVIEYCPGVSNPLLTCDFAAVMRRSIIGSRQRSGKR